jgi:hypothetical protein
MAAYLLAVLLEHLGPGQGGDGVVGPALTLLTLLLALLLIVGAGGGALIPSAQRYESPLLGIFVKKKRKQKVLNTL